MGEAGAGAARSSVAEVAPLEAAARGISARPGMRDSLPVTAAMVVRQVAAEKGVFLERGRKGAGRTSVRVFFYLSCGTHIAFYHKRIHPFGWITWLYYFRATVDALTKRSKRQ